MRNLLFIAIAVLITSCGGGGVDQEAIVGKWKLTDVIESPDAFLAKKGVYKITDCDKQMVWDFSIEKAEALGDGTEVMKLNVTAPEECEYYTWDAKWTVLNGKVFINSTRLGGMGGRSYAGQFSVTEQSESKLVLDLGDVQYVFGK